MKLNILFVEDERDYMESMREFLEKYLGDVNFIPYYRKTSDINVHYFDYRDLALYSIDENDYDLAIVDVVLPENKSNSMDLDGGKKIIDALLKKSAASKLSSRAIPIIQYTQYGDKQNVADMFQDFFSNPQYNSFSHCTFSKSNFSDKSTWDDYARRLFKKLIDVFKNRIHTIMIQNPSSLNDLLYAIKYNNEIKPITFNYQSWQMSDFIFNETKINGDSYFSKSEFENVINIVLEHTKGPVKGIWDRNPGLNCGNRTTVDDATKRQAKNKKQAIKLHERAHIIMNNSKLKKEIEQKTEDWFNEFIKITQNELTADEKNLKDEWNAKKDPFGKRIQKSDTDFDKVIINKLIWRRIVIRLYEIEKSVDSGYKTTNWIADVEKNGCFRESTDSDKKKLFSHLGFEYRDNTIYMHNLFPEEEDYISKF